MGNQNQTQQPQDDLQSTTQVADHSIPAQPEPQVAQPNDSNSYLNSQQPLQQEPVVQPNTGQKDSSYTLAIWGLVFAIMLPFVGLILCLIALLKKKSSELAKATNQIAIAGLIIGSVLTIFGVVRIANYINDPKQTYTVPDIPPAPNFDGVKDVPDF